MTLTNPAEDLALLNEMRRGSAAAFEALYRRHQGPLYRFALLRCGSPDTAADVVQEIFLALLADKLNFDPLRGALQGFLFGVARNLVLKREEANGRYLSMTKDSDDDSDELATVDPAPQPMERLLANETAETVRRALQSLAAHYRDVIILYEMHDMSYVEIAHICNIDIGTVRSRLSRARAKLAEMLGTVGDTARPAPIRQQEARP